MEDDLEDFYDLELDLDLAEDDAERKEISKKIEMQKHQEHLKEKEKSDNALLKYTNRQRCRLPVEAYFDNSFTLGEIFEKYDNNLGFKYLKGAVRLYDRKVCVKIIDSFTTSKKVGGELKPRKILSVGDLLEPKSIKVKEPYSLVGVLQYAEFDLSEGSELRSAREALSRKYKCPNLSMTLNREGKHQFYSYCLSPV